MPSPANKTAPETEARIVDLVRSGATRSAVAREVGVNPSTVSRVVRQTEGLEFARIGSGSSGTPEGAAKARGYRSEYMRARREQIADKLLDAAERSADRAKTEEDPRRLASLMQAADASMRAYSNVTKPDAITTEQEAMRGALSIFEKFSVNAELLAGSVLPPARPGLIQE